MNQTEVIAPEVERDSSFQIGQLTGEGQGETVKSSNLHPQRQILTLHIGRTDLAVIRDTENLGDHGSRYTRRRIAARARILGRIKLGDDGIRGAVAKEAANSWTIGPPRIGTDLWKTVNPPAQVGEWV